MSTKALLPPISQYEAENMHRLSMKFKFHTAQCEYWQVWSQVLKLLPVCPTDFQTQKVTCKSDQLWVTQEYLYYLCNEIHIYLLMCMWPPLCVECPVKITRILGIPGMT